MPYTRESWEELLAKIQYIQDNISHVTKWETSSIGDWSGETHRIIISVDIVDRNEKVE